MSSSSVGVVHAGLGHLEDGETSLGKSRLFSSSVISFCSLALSSSVAVTPAMIAPRTCSTPSSFSSRSSALTRAKRRKSSEWLRRRE